MKVIVHDLGAEYNEILQKKCDVVIHADGKYAPCQGCFGCWTKHPAECHMKDTLQIVCRKIGKADELIIISANCYGGYSPEVKNVLDRSIGVSTPFSTYRGKQMHHTLRYGKKKRIAVYAYGCKTTDEEKTFRYMVERNAINYGFQEFEFHNLENLNQLEDREL